MSHDFAIRLPRRTGSKFPPLIYYTIIRLDFGEFPNSKRRGAFQGGKCRSRACGTAATMKAGHYSVSEHQVRVPSEKRRGRKAHVVKLVVGNHGHCALWLTAGLWAKKEHTVRK